MTKPLALAFFGNLVLGSKLVNRLEETGYRVSTVADASKLAECAEREKPLVVLVEVTSGNSGLYEGIRAIKAAPSTQHIPILAYASSNAAQSLASARESGANLVASDGAILAQLPFLLDQVLQMD